MGGTEVQRVGGAPGELLEEQRQRAGWVLEVHAAAEPGGQVADVVDESMLAAPFAGVLDDGTGGTRGAAVQRPPTSCVEPMS